MRSWARRNLPCPGRLSTTRRHWLAALILWPRRSAAALYWRYVEPLPGDRFWNYRRAVYGEYIGGGQIAVASHQMLVAFGLGKDWLWSPLPPGAVIAVEPWDAQGGWVHG